MDRNEIDSMLDRLSAILSLEDRSHMATALSIVASLCCAGLSPAQQEKLGFLTEILSQI